MKVNTLALAATLVTGAVASPNHHGHLHRHARRQQLGSPLEKRDAVTVTTVVAAYVTSYQNADGSKVDEKEAKDCIKKGNCKVVGSVVPTLEPPPPPSTTTTSSLAAAFFESKSSVAPTTTTTSEAPASTTASKTESKGSSGTSSSGKGLDVDFPTDVPCGTFPSDWGAVALPWVGLGGWSTIQQLGAWDLKSLVGKFSQANSGPCNEGDVCSYACPAGYDKTQWPEEGQGAEGQSIGGLQCSGGVLKLTRPSEKKLCRMGDGRVKVVNKLKKLCSICKTDYPGNERMSIAYEIPAGGESILFNPRASETYKWKNSKTTAQYYVNQPGKTKEDACIWGNPGDDFGNYSPTNLGIGNNDNDETFIGLFANKPSSTATLDFDIYVSVNGAVQCTLKSGVYSGPQDGCTAAAMSGSSAVITLVETGASP